MTDALAPVRPSPPRAREGASSPTADHTEGMSYLETLPRRLVTLYLPLSIILQMTLFPHYGIALLVCVLHHIVHLMMDGYLVERLRQ